MRWIGAIVAAALIIVVFIDAFEAVVLPRRVKHGYRLARLYYQYVWVLWRGLSRRLPPGRFRSGLLSIFGPMSLFGLLGIWAVGLILGFALLHIAFETALSAPAANDNSFATYFYFSGTTFFTLGYGDIVPTRGWGRALSVAEAGIGFGFLAIIISYVPVLYQTFSRREIVISLLDARAGSPPSAGELLRRLAVCRNFATAGPLLASWEQWSAELLESHLSFPIVSYYRSQHDNQSWVATLTVILDTSALLIAASDGGDDYQARLTFAMARHAAVDLGLMFQTRPTAPAVDPVPSATVAGLVAALRVAGFPTREAAVVETRFAALRRLYEPFVKALGEHFEFDVPQFQVDQKPVDNWQTSPWMARAPSLHDLPTADSEHPRPDRDLH